MNIEEVIQSDKVDLGRLCGFRFIRSDCIKFVVTWRNSDE